MTICRCISGVDFEIDYDDDPEQTTIITDLELASPSTQSLEIIQVNDVREKIKSYVNNMLLRNLYDMLRSN